MEKLAKILAVYLSEHQEKAEFSFELYQYGIQVALEMLSAVLTGFLTAVFMEMTAEYIVFMILFFFLRSYAGGLHFAGFGKCFLCSLIITAGNLWVTKHYHIPIRVLCLMMAVFAAVLFIVKPVNSSNKEVTDEESRYFMRRLRMILITTLLFFVFCIVIKQNKYATLTALTVMLTFILMLIGRWRERAD